MMDRKESVEKMREILRIEYGIRTESELDAAISRLSVIDISPFCGEINKRRWQNDNSRTYGRKTANT